MTAEHKIVMVYKKSTPGTHVYENPNDTYITSVYVKKNAFNGAMPKVITLVVIEGLGEEELTDVDNKTP